MIITAPPGVLPEARLRDVLEYELASLQELLLRHFASEEEGGWLSQLVSNSPALASAAQELRTQHGALRAEFESLVTGVRSTPLPQLVERIGAALEMFDAHEHTEAQLLAGDAR